MELTYLSQDGEEGYPGELRVTASYTLTADNELCLEITAVTDKDTVVNLTQHSYFNLAGEGDVLGHQLYIDADRIVPVDATLIPTGQLRPVAGTPFDFRQPTAIGSRIDQNDEQLKLANGYDHTFVLNHPAGRLDLAARVTEPATGRVLEVLTTEPGVQLYTGNFLDGTIREKSGAFINAATPFAWRRSISRILPISRIFPVSCSSRDRSIAIRLSSNSPPSSKRTIVDQTGVKLNRACQAVQIPLGAVVTLPAGTVVDVAQTLGGNYTVRTAAGLFRIGPGDVDALGIAPPASLMEEVARKPESAGPADEKQVWDTLKTCFDPEIPVNIVDLGLVYDLNLEPLPGGNSKVLVKMTLTAPGCGMGTVIASDAQQKLLCLPGVDEAVVEIVWTPRGISR